MKETGKKKRRTRIILSFVFLGVLIVVFLVWNINAGSVQLSISDIFRILFGMGADDTSNKVIWSIRLPRIAAALILGGSLSVSGFLLQTFFHNPIAGPFVLGISSGAKLTVSLCMIFLLSRDKELSPELLLLI